VPVWTLWIRETFLAPARYRTPTIHPIAIPIKLSGNEICCLIKKLHGLSPRANYNDRATAACRRSECQLLRIEVPRGQRDGSLRPYSRFSRQEPLLFSRVAPQLYKSSLTSTVRNFSLIYLFLTSTTRHVSAHPQAILKCDSYKHSCTHEAEWTPFQTHYFFFW
jgi:hypothetical protein